MEGGGGTGTELILCDFLHIGSSKNLLQASNESSHGMSVYKFCILYSELCQIYSFFPCNKTRYCAFIHRVTITVFFKGLLYVVFVSITHETCR